MAGYLTANERRVLGVLMEKSMAHPEYYPMTLNAIVAGCNQKQNRDPVMTLDEDVVWNALESLREHSLVTVVLPGPGARSKKYRHQAHEQLEWDRPQQAVMAELLLRGPQTVGELRGRCARLAPFADAAAVGAVLDQLGQAAPPFVRVLPRGTGQSADRYCHTLYPKEEEPATTTAAAPAAHPAPPSNDLAELREELVAHRAELDELRRRIEVIEDALK